MPYRGINSILDGNGAVVVEYKYDALRKEVI